MVAAHVFIARLPYPVPIKHIPVIAHLASNNNNNNTQISIPP